MIFLGILGILQMIAIPGLLLWHALRFKGGIVLRLAGTFGWSLLANFLAVFLLTAIGLYQRTVVLALIGVEIIALAWVYRSFWTASLGEVVKRIWNWARKNILSWFSAEDSTSFSKILMVTFTVAAAVLALAELDWAVRVFRANLGTVFNSWDAVLSWNRWAVQWSQNRFPVGTGNYPQLLPANWSLTYVLTGADRVELFAKAIIPLFTFLILLGLFDLGLDTRQAGYWIGVVLAQLMIKKFVGEYISEGYADLPVACLGFLSVYVLLKAREPASQEQRHRVILLSAGLVAAAALTKQVGLYFLVVAPLLAYLLLYPQQGGMTWWQKARPILFTYGAAALVVATWYGFRQTLIFLGIEHSEVLAITGFTGNLYRGAGVLARFVAAMQALEKYFWLLPFLLLVLLFLDRRARWISLIVVFPYILFWGGFASYDTRNLTLALPFLALAVGLAIEKLVRLVLLVLDRLKIPKAQMWVWGLVMLASAVGLIWVWPDSRLQAQQEAQQRQLFNPVLNEKLYALLEKEPAEVQVLTNYPLAYLPGLEQRQANFWFSNFAEFQALVRQKNIEFILMPPYASDQIEQFVEEKVKSGDYKLLFEDDHFVPYRMFRITRNSP